MPMFIAEDPRMIFLEDGVEFSVRDHLNTPVGSDLALCKRAIPFFITPFAIAVQAKPFEIVLVPLRGSAKK
jgi:hypothetical protein